MKQKLIMMLIAAIAALSVNAQKTSEAEINAGSFKDIVIAGNMNVVMQTGTGTPSNLAVSNEAADKLDITISGKTLRLEPKQWSKKATVCLTVANLQKLSIGENTIVRINGTIVTPELQLFIAGDSKAYLRTTGKIRAYAMGDAEINISPVSINARIEKAL